MAYVYIYIYPEARTLLRGSFPDAVPQSASAADLYAAMNVVREPSMIRVEADEVSYVMHVILR